MCNYLKISRSLIYYELKNKADETELENAVIKAFKDSKNNYGTRKLKIELAKSEYNIVVSRRKIGKIMAKFGLVSNYTIKQFKVHKSTCNEDKTANLVKREFGDRDELKLLKLSLYLTGFLVVLSNLNIYYLIMLIGSTISAFTVLLVICPQLITKSHCPIKIYPNCC